MIGDRSFTMQEVNTLVPVSYDDASGWIVSECDAVIPSLPKTDLGTEKGEVARVTKGMAMALKARVLLYAASPLNNPGGDAARYLEAAAAAKELIDAGIYKLVSEETTNNADAQGLIFGKWCPVSSDFEAANFPVGFEGGNSGVCPSQNLAEAFDMATGEPFDWNDESMRSRMFVASARDPRFARTLIYNGATFKGQPVQSYVGGRNGRPLDGATPTSYYLRKHIVEATSFVTGSEMSYQHIFPFFRYAEVLLNYAEALAAATQNPDFTGMKGEVEYTLSPREALNAVRARYNMPGITETDYAAFVKRLRNERRVELAFEGHRFWDIRRWKIGAETTKVYGLTITPQNDGSFSYVRSVIQQRGWDDRMNYYPIADAELFKNHNLVQNDGWK